MHGAYLMNSITNLECVLSSTLLDKHLNMDWRAWICTAWWACSEHWVFDESDSAQYLVPDNLLLRHSVEPLNVSDDDGHDEVDHDDGAEDDEPHQQYHGEDLGQAWACILTAVPQIIELKLSWNMDKHKELFININIEFSKIMFLHFMGGI